MNSPRELRMTPPVASAWTIDRPRLTSLLEERPVCVLAGMAGYGKSTLLAAAAQRERGATMWLTLDDTDRDPLTLVADLVTAAWTTRIEALADPLEQLRGPSLRAEPLSLVDSLLEALYDGAGPMLLALDDLQHIGSSPAATRIIDHLLRWAPDNVRIVIAARVVPPMRLQRLRLEDRLTYLTHDELAFTPEECVAAVRAAGLDLERGTADTIHRVTGGWPAGVRMAVLAARNSGVASDLSVGLRRDQALAEYLATEVLASLPPNLRGFVFESCLDDEVCPSLIDTVRATANAEALLEQCLAAGLFLSRVDSPRSEQWYRWHPLFAAHTRRRLAVEQPELVTRLHASAASWWKSTDTPTAIGHALAAGDGEAASKIFAEGWLVLFLKGEVDAALTAIDRLPKGSAYRSDAHLVKALIMVLRDRLSEARTELDSARGASVALPDVDRARLDERTALVEFFIDGCELGLGVAAASGIALLEALDAESPPPDSAVRASVQMVVGMGEARLQACVETPLALLRASARTARETGLTALELTALAESCIPAIAEGRLTEVHVLAVDVLARAEARGWGGLVTLAPAVASLGLLDYWRGNLYDSRSQLERSLAMLRPFDWELRGLTLASQTEVCLSLGDVRAARTSVTQIGDLGRSRQTPWWWPSMLAGLEGLVLAAEGQTARAVAGALTAPAGPEYRMAAAHRATVLLRAGRTVEALSALEHAPASTGFVHIECLQRCLEAEALAVLDKGAAHQSLEMALAAAQPDGLWGPFLAAGDDLTDLLKVHLRRGTSHPAAVTQVLGRIAQGKESHRSSWGEPLTDRERVILRYLATNLTNREIADAEFISVHTAKTHIAHIYRKLGVNSRRSAVRRSAELDLY